MKAEFKALVERVRAIDPAAAEYLVVASASNKDFSLNGDLSCVMTWEDTPQGHAYWSDIQRKLNSTECPSTSNWKTREHTRLRDGTYVGISIAGDDPDRFLHLSNKVLGSVAYTANEVDGVADVQRTTTLPRYCEKFGLGKVV